MSRSSPVLQSPVFIVGCHKSGTTLLRALLDGHPDLAPIPIEAHFFQESGFWVDYALRRSLPREMSDDEIVTALEDHVAAQNAENNPFSDSAGFGGIDLDIFRGLMKFFCGASIREKISIYLNALAVAYFGSKYLIGRRIVEKSVENCEFAEALTSLFPGATFIHVVRNPYATLVSIRKAKTVDRFPYLARLVGAQYSSYKALFHNRALITGYEVVRYEDLVTDTDATMHRVARHIGVDFSPSLLMPTRRGAPWGGNSTSGLQFGGVSTAPTEIWKKEVQPLEIALVNRIAEPVIGSYGYDRLDVGRGYRRPCRKETAKTYILNRSLLWYWPL